MIVAAIVSSRVYQSKSNKLSSQHPSVTSFKNAWMIESRRSSDVDVLLATTLGDTNHSASLLHLARTSRGDKKLQLLIAVERAFC
jgi:hypothetical protein